METIEYNCDIDFFNELKQMKCKASQSASSPAQATDSVNVSTSDTPHCLITDEPLRKDHITLQCGHKFNYVPLFKEVLFQKCSLLPKNISMNIITMYTNNTQVNSLPIYSSVTSSSESKNTNIVSVTYNSSYNLETMKLQYNEMKCPYCRTITNNILPFYPYPEVCKVKYVNSPSNLALPSLSCEYRQSTTGKGSKTSHETGLTTTCRNACVYNEKYDMMICNKHLTKKNTEETIELKISPRRTRNHESTTNSSTYDIITNDVENIIVSHHNPATSVCSFILLSGARKGTPCGKPMWIPNTIKTPIYKTYCKAHWNRVTLPTSS